MVNIKKTQKQFKWPQWKENLNIVRYTASEEHEKKKQRKQKLREKKIK